MPNRRHVLSLAVALFAFALPSLVSRGAAAQEACGDSECPKGYVCESVPTPCDDADCVPTVTTTCVAAACTSDADCASDMTCASLRQTDCTSAEPCPPEDVGTPNCPPPTEPDCETTTVSQCVPHWVLPCTANADCGEGFTCEEGMSCGCSGSGGSSGEPAPPDCTCEGTGTFACRLIVTPCANDGDCASGWSCRDNPERVCSSSSDGTEECTPGDPPKLCMPPYVDLVEGYGRAVSEGSDAPTSDPGTPKGGSQGSADEGAANGSDDAGGCSMAPVGRFASLASFFLMAALVSARRIRSKRRAPDANLRHG